MRGPTDNRIASWYIARQLDNHTCAIEKSALEEIAGGPMTEERYQRLITLIGRKVERMLRSLRKEITPV